MSGRLYDLKNWQDHFDVFILNQEKVQEQTCEKLKSDFGLSDDEAKNYYEMIKDEENNKIIEEVEKKVRVKVAQTGSFNIEFSGQKK
jgi:hypothetical protein